MRHIMKWVWIAAVVALCVPLGALAQGNTPQRVLRVVETSPQVGEELLPGELVVLRFDSPLDCATVDDHVTLGGAPVEGECDGATLSVDVTGLIPPGETLDLAIEPGVRAEGGFGLGARFVLPVQARGFLRVISTVPQVGMEEIDTDTAIVVVFDRPVVPLTTLDDQAGLPQPLTLQPEVAGVGEWLGTSVYQFTPATALSGGTVYVGVVDGLTAVDGAPLETAYSWNFATRPPLVANSLPADDEEGVPLTQAIQMTFSEPMDVESVESAFGLVIGDTPAQVAGAFEWNDDLTGFMFTPDERLALDTEYRFGWPEDSVFNAGQRSALPGFTSRFFTVPGPAIVATYPRDGAEFVQPYGGISLYFASKINPETVMERVTIDPLPEVELDGYFSEYDNRYDILFPLLAETQYTITVAPGIEDVYGNAIETGRTFSFVTGEEDPELSFNIPWSGIGVYDSQRESTELFVTHRNVEQVNLYLHTVDTSLFFAELNSEQFYQTVDTIVDQNNPLVRAWVLPGSEVRNVRRLDLVNVGAGGGEVNGVSIPPCEGAMPSRATIGDRGRIITTPEPTRAREAPVDGEIIELLYEGYAFTIVGGPRCSDGILWWEIVLRDERRAWIAEGLDDEYFFEITREAQAGAITVPLEFDGGPLPEGVYLLTADVQELGDIDIPVGPNRFDVRHIMVVADTALTVKRGPLNTLVWATDMHTGLPLANVAVDLFNAAGVASGVTDADGVANIAHDRVDNLYDRYLVIVNSDGRFGVTSSNWSDGLFPYQFDIAIDSYPSQYQIYVITDRPVYRPGQPVHYKVIAREKTDNDYTVTAGLDAFITFRNESFEPIDRVTVPLSEYGTAAGTFTIDENGGLGSYTITAELSLPEDVRYNSGQVYFDVAEYRLPEFQVGVTPEQAGVLQGETARAVVDTRYFFGGPVSNATIDYYISAQPYFFPYDGPGRYQFYDFNPDSGQSARLTAYSGSDSVVADENGMFTIEFPASIGSTGRSVEFVIEAVASDESGQSVSGRATVVAHQGQFYIGVQPGAFVGTAGLPLAFNLLTVDWDSQSVPNTTFNVQVVERRWNSVQELDPYSADIVWRSEVEEIEVASGTVTTNERGETSFEFVPPNGGIFKLIATGTDSEGNIVTSSGMVWVSGGEYVAWRQTNQTSTEIITDQQRYEVGDTAEILITSPFNGPTEALITLERGGVLRSERVTLTTNSTVYRLPIEADFAPTIYFSVVLIKGVDENNPVTDMRFGYATLQVDNSQFELDIDIQPDRETAGPRDEVTFTFTVRDHTGQPVQTELSAALTDLAALSLGEDRFQPILDFFYGPQPLSVLMASVLTINTDLITQYTRDVIKGGGGGGGGEFGVLELREEFIDTAFWEGQLETGPDGTAQVTISLPDNLTTWRMNVFGVTAGIDEPMKVGQQNEDIVATKPLIVRPVAPRFFVVGDDVMLGAVLNNNTDADITADVTLFHDGVTLATADTQQVTVPARGRARVSWLATVGDVEAVELVFSAEGGGVSDATRPQFGQGEDRLLPVRKFVVPEFVGTGGVLRQAGARVEAVVLPTRYQVAEGTLTIDLEPSLAVSAVKAVRAFEAFACDCAEAVASRLLANVTALRMLNATGSTDAELLADLREQSVLAIQRLIAQQKVDGGWGWYPTLDSSPLVTSWVLIALTEAEDNGFTVLSSAVSEGGRYLGRNLGAVNRNTRTYLLNRHALLLYALSRSGSTVSEARVSELFDLRDLLDVYGRALLLRTMATGERDYSREIGTLRSDLIGTAVLSANGANWEEGERDYLNWNSNTRTTAMALWALLSVNADEPLLPNVVRWLMIARRADLWETTQETAWSLMALTEWMIATDETQPDYSFTVSVSDAELLARTLTPADATARETVSVPIAELAQDEANLVEIDRTDGQGALYYTAYLNAFVPVPNVQAASRGITLSRVYRLQGSDATTTTAQVGDLVQVEVTLIAPAGLNFVVLEDSVPAGLEPIDPGLDTAQQTDTDAEFERGGVRYGRVWWADVQYRDDRVVLSADYVPAGTYTFTYVARATVEGVYNVIPTTAREFYLPEVYGRAAGAQFTVQPAEE
ncbi:MAG: Ig-like domain-containing protein [Chloroflexi bacterium]|nr:Ig-like domain-containing protein [Chloroflexota bacterium]